MVMLYSYFKTRANVYAEKFQRGLGEEIKEGGCVYKCYCLSPSFRIFSSPFALFFTFLSHIEKFKMRAEGATGHATPIPPSVSTLEMHVFSILTF